MLINPFRTEELISIFITNPKEITHIKITGVFHILLHFIAVPLITIPATPCRVRPASITVRCGNNSATPHRSMNAPQPTITNHLLSTSTDVSVLPCTRRISYPNFPSGGFTGHCHMLFDHRCTSRSHYIYSHPS
jgi:hypothetical protein